MGRNRSSLVSSVALSLCMVGCIAAPAEADLAPSENEAEPLGVARGAVLDDNALTPNALTPNALTPNALTPNALTPNALTPNALTPEALASLRDPGTAGALSRALVKYVVSCAFDPSQSLSFSWTDAEGITHDENYPGLVGLAPGWAGGGIDATTERWISACVISRINWYGVTVTLSSRGAHPALATTVAERSTYSHLEGAFWGDIFATTPVFRACHDDANVTHSRAEKRDCAAGHLEADGSVTACGPIAIVGSCAELCAPSGAKDGHFASCGGQGETITAFLQ